jgi:tetratricopeptide (TPR) repeat protein
VVAFRALWKRSRLISFGFVWFFLTLAPVLNSRWLGPNVFTERYLYLPSVGFCWVAAWGILRIRAQAAGRKPAWGAALGIALGVVGVLAAVRIVTRNRDWRDEVTYYRVTLAAEPEAAGLRINLGAVYWNHMQPDAAEREWRAALPTSPHSALLLNNLGLVYARKKQYGDAADCFQRSMRLRPNFTDAHLNLGRIDEETGKTPEAELQLRAAAALAPLSVQARNELGHFYFTSGRWREAEEQFHASVASIANSTAYDGIGDTNVRLGRRDVAEQAYRQALALDDADSHAHFGLAAILAFTGREGEALAHYQAGLRLDPLNPEARSAFERLKSNSSYVNPSNK